MNTFRAWLRTRDADDWLRLLQDVTMAMLVTGVGVFALMHFGVL